MPRGDATGPMGMGPMTGRGAGYCAGYNMPGYLNNAAGRGWGRGFGRGGGFWGRGGGRGGGFGWRNRFLATGVPGWYWFGGYSAPYQNVDPEMEKSALKNHADFLENELKSIKARIDEIETSKQAK